jgi:putative acyl-CoA dehydrogenase
MECLGGNGYVEEAPLARLYREAPLNGIWEGSANVICLDALRASGSAAEAFCGARLEMPHGGRAFGTLPPEVSLGEIVQRAALGAAGTG